MSLKDEPDNGMFEPEFLVKLEDTEDEAGTRLRYLGQPSENTVSMKTRQSILDAIEAEKDWVTIKWVADKVKVAKNTAKEHLDALFDVKLILREMRGGKWYYGPPTAQTTQF